MPANDVAVISFTGGTLPGDEVSRMQDGRPFIVLRSGDIIAGRLIDIGGDNPLRLTVRTPDGNQEFSSNDVARIYLARWEGMPSASASSASSGAQAQLEQGGPGMPVPATAVLDQHRHLRRTGPVRVVQWLGRDSAERRSQRRGGGDGLEDGPLAQNAPIPAVPAGALIGRVGEGRPFGIGDQRQPLGMPAAGDLWLGINDDHCADNRGEFHVQINARRR